MEVLTSRLLPACSLATPNAREAAALLGRPVDTIEGATTAAVELCQRYNCSVLVKGGHLEGKGAADVLATRAATTLLEGRRDFSAGDNNVDGGVHGTGCVLSSAVAARMAFGRETLLDAVVGAKALCAEAISNSVAVGKGARAALPPPLWPSPLSSSFVPSIGKEMARAFPRTTTEMKLYALADSSERVQALFDAGVKDVQLRVKTSREDLQNAAVPSAKAAREAGARLWINDDWRVASEVGAYGVHLGQEDIAEDVDDLEELAESGLRLGVSTHCLSELAVATAIRPSYVALGPIFGTTSKEIAFDARGTDMVRNFRNLVPSDTPLVAIGGVDLSNAESVLAAGADSIAVISVKKTTRVMTTTHRLTAGPSRSSRRRRLSSCRSKMGLRSVLEATSAGERKCEIAHENNYSPIFLARD